jgi:hypothetical protein
LPGIPAGICLSLVLRDLHLPFSSILNNYNVLYVKRPEPCCQEPLVLPFGMTLFPSPLAGEGGVGA